MTQLRASASSAAFGSEAAASASDLREIPTAESWMQFNEIKLDVARLEKARIISHDVLDPRATSYDFLRTQLLQAMDAHNWTLVGVTSPTKGCGKTLTAINLALSITRQTNRSALVVDMDLRKPQLANRLGVRSNVGLLDVLEGRAAAWEGMFWVRAGEHRMLVLPTDQTDSSSEYMASPAMSAFIHDLKRDFGSHIIVVDLPPMLVSDDVIAVLPQLHCMLLVTAVGVSTQAEIEECSRHLQSTNLVRVVVNKTSEVASSYY